MKNTDKPYAEILYGLLEENSDTESVVSGFLKFLQGKGKLVRVPKIIKEFEKIYNAKNGISNLKIKSAHELDAKIIQQIAASLGIKEYELQTEIDKNLIGGFVAQYGDTLIDASLKNNLNKLHNQLTL